ncbi:MmgE/PrpD family protein [Leucobacter sp. USHLN153]|uniref:MmgE/PrpD family protein n=1 Tax=Leucobacter sp. USHLN153 TaxID=3081268 RepID=UPI0030195E02
MVSRLLESYEAVPESVTVSARLHFLDAIGVAFAASKHGPVARVTELSSDAGGASTLLGTGGGASPAVAALANGTLMHSLEYDDTHTASVVHGSSVMASTALAVGEEVGATVDEMLRAFTIGWEFFIRIGLACPGGLQARGFQVTSAAGPFAAALVAGLLRKSPQDEIANAIGIAGSQAGGTFAFLADGDTVKSAQAGWAAHSGVLAHDLARTGVSGPDGVFDGDYGFFRLYAADDPAGERLFALCEDIGERWLLTEAAFKLLPCCHYIHPFVEALGELVAEVGGRQQVASVRCDVPSEVIPIIAEPWASRQRPARAQDARWSLPYVLAWLLEHGEVGFGTFVGSVSERVMATAESVSFEPWEGSGFPTRFPARVHVTTRAGTRVSRTVDDVLGSAARPIPPGRVVGKARSNFESAGTAGAEAERLLEALQHPGSAVADLTDALRAAPQVNLEREAS